MKKSFYAIVLIIPSFLCSMEKQIQQVTKAPYKSVGIPIGTVTKGKKLLTGTDPLENSPTLMRVRSQSDSSPRFLQEENFKGRRTSFDSGESNK